MTIDDEVGLLYSSQMQFGLEGVPLVTIGIMEQQKSVSVSCPKGCVLSFLVESDGQWERKTRKPGEGATIVFEVARATPAKVAYWCGVGSIPFGEREILKRAKASWRDRGESLQVFEAGSVFGIRGHVIDNRVYILAIRPHDTEEQAGEEVSSVFTRYGDKTFVHSHLSSRPSGRIRIKDKDGREVAQALDLVGIRSADERPVIVRRVESGRGYRWHGFEDRQYAGTVLIILDRPKHEFVSE